MKLKIIQTGDPILRQQARTLSLEEIQGASIQQLIQLMRETMLDAPGVGLAAPQIGESLQLIVIEDRPEYTQHLSDLELKRKDRTPIPFHVIINPTLTIKSTEEAEFYEGCLSMAGFVSVVPRLLTVRVDCLNEKGEPTIIEAKGWYARILQHEIDHLQGTLCIDRMKLKTLTTLENFNKYYK